MTIKRWCESGKLPAIAKPYGNKTTWLISPQAVEMIATLEASAVKQKKKAQQKSHIGMLPAWVNAMAKGTLNGRVYSERTIQDYCHYVGLYFSKYSEVRANHLKKELMAIPAVQFAKREHYYKSILCLGNFLRREGCLDDHFQEEVKPLYPKRHLPPKRFTVDEESLGKLLAECQTTQERLIVLLLSHTGLRASEASALLWSDIDFLKDSLTVRLGKGGKTRRVGLTKTLADALLDHLRDANLSLKPFILRDKHGKAMTRSGLYQRLERIGRSVGVKVSPHALRRAFVTLNANKGRSLVMLQMACGHSDIKITRNYCMTAEQEVIDAMKNWD